MADAARATSVRRVPSFDGLDGVELLEAVDPAGDPVPGPRVALVARLHGNEPVGEVALQRLAVEAPGRLAAGSVLAVVANLEARALGVRHTPCGVDMNRLWDAERLATLADADPDTLSSEERRVRVLAPAVLGCDVVLDLHSTSRPSPPHLIFRDDARHDAVARRLGVERLVTGVHENAVLEGGVCANIGLRPREHGPRLGFTLEAGQHAEPQNLERAWSVVERLLAALGLWAPDPGPEAPDPAVYEIVGRVRQAGRDEPAWRFDGWDGGAGSGPSGRTLASFERVEAGEVVLRREDGEVLRAASAFVMLMPAPSAAPGEDLYFVARPRP